MSGLEPLVLGIKGYTAARGILSAVNSMRTKVRTIIRLPCSAIDPTIPTYLPTPSYTQPSNARNLDNLNRNLDRKRKHQNHDPKFQPRIRRHTRQRQRIRQRQGCVCQFWQWGPGLCVEIGSWVEFELAEQEFVWTTLSLSGQWAECRIARGH